MAMTGILRRLMLGLSFLAVLAAAQRPAPFKQELEGTPLMITPNIMTGILVGLVWVTLFMTGFCCLFQVQTPQAYEEKCLVLNKQY
mmetsp:Transcript_101276/g.139881  ORF Transcript_101276/g.139881 Transcript_101276/m.139881 type:complete len:86 (+) Transcript_101276:82-339(+)